ncbi:MAG: GumC family protein [Thermodesulfobacteriota bacterium]
MSEEQNEYEINLLDYWAVVARHRKLITMITAGAFLVSVVVSLLLPKTYLSRASIMPPQQDSTVASGLLSSLPFGLGGGLLGLQTPTDLWVGILNSQSVKDSIIERFNLRELYGTETIEDTREVLDKAVTIEKSKEEIISISVEDWEPERAASMANAFIEELDRVNREAVMSAGKRMRTFVEKRLNEAKYGLAETENKLRIFQEKNKAVKLDEQSERTIEVIGTLKGELMAKEVAMKTLLSYATVTNPRVEILKAEIGELKGQLKELTEGSGEGDIFIPTGDIPQLAVEYARLVRDAKVQETLFELLTQQYELARIQEAKDSPTVHVLDVGKPPEKKYRPQRTLIVVVSTFMAGLCAVLASFIMEYTQKSAERFSGS